MQGSPELGRSPLGTPLIGLDGQPLIHTGYQTSPTESNFSFNNSGGIAQRMDGLAVSSQGQGVHESYANEPPKPENGTQAGIEPAYQYQPAYGYGTLPVQYQAYPPGALYQWPTQQDYSTSYPSDMDQHQVQRHVSTSFIPTQMRMPPSHLQPRSLSANIVPMLPTDIRSGDSFPTSFDSYQTSYQPQERMMMDPSSSNFQTHSSSFMPPMNSAESSEGRPAKRQKAKFPPVGKRLKPGPKPKPKTPRKGSMASLEVQQVPGSASQCFDPFVIAAKSVGTPNSAYSDVGSSHAPSSSQIHAPVPAHARRVSLLDGEVSSLEQGMAVIPSTVPKAVLETLYDCFMVQEDAAAQPSKRYRCNIDDCGREFPRKSAIHSHIQTHLEDKPFMCTEPDW
jgi:hypothetical protein